MTVPIPIDNTGRPRIHSLLKFLGKRDYTNILVEGGPELMASFLAQNLVDEAHIFIAPIVIGGKKSRHAVGGEDLPKLADAVRLQFTAATRSGPDIHIVARREHTIR